MFERSLGSKLVLSIAALVVAVTCSPVGAQPTHQCFTLEFFYDSSVDDAAGLQAALANFAAERTGLKVSYHDLHESEPARDRVAQIAKYFRLQQVQLPAVYGLKYVVANLKTQEQLRSRLREILTLTAYVRAGCAHCNDAKAFLAKYESRYPALEIEYREVVGNAQNRQAMQAVVSRYQQSAASLPVLHFCNGLSVGFDREATTGRSILQTLDYWSQACPVEKKKPRS